MGRTGFHDHIDFVVLMSGTRLQVGKLNVEVVWVRLKPLSTIATAVLDFEPSVSDLRLHSGDVRRQANRR